MTVPGASVAGLPLSAQDPSSIGVYTLQRRLGQGGMGTVYLGHDPHGRPVAVKVIRPEFARDDDFRRRFAREAQSARGVRRFCTADVLDAGTDSEQPYLVTEFVAGPTLAQVVTEGGPLSPGNLEGVAVGIAQALVAIHAAGIVHRDLKPGNVMLSPYGLRVIDFGIAQATEAAGLTGFRIGTPAFMAPEQVMGRRLTGALDVFAWGAVVAYAGTGRLPFGPAGDGLFDRILHGPPDLAGLRGHDLYPVLEQALRKDPSERPTAEGLVVSLTGRTASSADIGPVTAAATRLTEQWSSDREESAPDARDRWTTDLDHGWATGPGDDAPTDLGDDATVVRPDLHPSFPGGRQPAFPPIRPEELAEATVARGPHDARPHRARRILLAGAALVVVAALVVTGLLVFGGHGPTTPTATKARTKLPARIPRSARVADDTMVVQRVVGGRSVLFQVTATGSGEQRLGDDTPKELPALSPDRRTIAYAVPGSGAIRVMSTRGDDARPLLVGAAAVLEPCAHDRVAWAPDGTRVALCAKGPRGTGLYTVDISSGAYVKLGAQAQAADPAWSPKGDRIAYRTGPGSDGGPLYLVAADGTGTPHLLADGVDAEPTWSPDGGEIAFRGKTDTGDFDVFFLDLGGAAPVAHDITAGAGAATADSSPSYWPGRTVRQLVFVSTRTGVPLLYVTQPANLGADVTVVPGQTVGSTHPAWSSGPRP